MAEIDREEIRRRGRASLSAASLSAPRIFVIHKGAAGGRRKEQPRGSRADSVVDGDGGLRCTTPAWRRGAQISSLTSAEEGLRSAQVSSVLANFPRSEVGAFLVLVTINCLPPGATAPKQGRGTPTSRFRPLNLRVSARAILFEGRGTMVQNQRHNSAAAAPAAVSDTREARGQWTGARRARRLALVLFNGRSALSQEAPVPRCRPAGAPGGSTA